MLEPTTPILWQEVDLFFMQKGKVYETLQNLARNLSREEIDYALVGGMALAAHGYVRLTQDVDLLMTSESLEQFQSRLIGRGFVPAFPGAKRRFRDASTNVLVEILVTGEYPGDGKPKSVQFPNPSEVAIELEGVRVVCLERLVELKLASGISAGDRLKDLADVIELIRTLKLPQDLAAQLDFSVRDEYLRLWQSVEEAEFRDSDRY